MKQRIKNLSFFCLAMISTLILSAQDDADKIVGVWKNGEGTGMVKIYKNGNNYQGKIVWLKEPIDPETGKPKLDKHNPDKSFHSRPLIGIINSWRFVYKGEKVWDDGKIYDPKTGKTYDCIIKMKNDNTLHVRGYIGISLIGRTDTWTREDTK